MTRHLRPALVLIALFTALTGLALPLGFTGAAQLAAPFAANGSLIRRNGVVVGSALIGQDFTAPGYFHGRPGATTAPDPHDASKTIAAPYNAAASNASNLGPTSKALLDRVKADRAAIYPGTASIPGDALTSSASGLDPDISPQNAASQAARIAAARHLTRARVQALIDANTTGRALGLFGEPHVRVLALNLALDAAAPQ